MKIWPFIFENTQKIRWI